MVNALKAAISAAMNTDSKLELEELRKICNLGVQLATAKIELIHVREGLK